MAFSTSASASSYLSERRLDLTVEFYGVGELLESLAPSDSVEQRLAVAQACLRGSQRLDIFRDERQLSLIALGGLFLVNSTAA